MLDKKLLFILFLFTLVQGFAQPCTNVIEGYIKDAGTGLGLVAVNIYVEETKQATSSQEQGAFKLEGLCLGDYHLLFSHVGCEPQRVFIQLRQDTSLFVFLDHSNTMLQHVEIVGNTNATSTQAKESLNDQYIDDNANQNLSNMLEKISGVSTLRNGAGIAKPVVHGMYGNRLMILNNGIVQSGQQWGNDHSPEIDPLVANKISVIKGVGSLEYQGASLGSVVLVEPSKIDREPHLHGKTTYYLASNGWGNGLNLQLQQYSNRLVWRLNGTLKKNGDQSTPSYLLRNTGSQEWNLALQLEKNFSDRWLNDVYISSFNTTLGILRGSHISNLTDLTSAFQRDEPFYTDNQFRYTLQAPKQGVGHHLLKIHSKYIRNEHQILDFTVATQYNNRREYDVRRSGRSELPALSLQQFTTFVEAKLSHHFKHELQLKTGIQSNIIDNANNPETGILPLIPDYWSLETGAFVTLQKHTPPWCWEFGTRYDHVLQNVAAISRTLPRKIVRYQNNFNNINASAGLNYQMQRLTFTGNVGYAVRNPAINELYSNGLHQGVSGIEEGSETLRSERAIKATVGINATPHKHWKLEALAYYQHIDDYIFLEPQDEIRLTIRGAFPVFAYRQTQARIIGVDITNDIELHPHWNLNLSASYLLGDDLSNEVPLIYMPANNAQASLEYTLGAWRKLENITCAVQQKYVFEQTHLLASQDFVVAPESYYLLGWQCSAERQVKSIRLRFFNKIDNLLNISYRDYLNRQRYFADDLGINVVLGVQVRF